MDALVLTLVDLSYHHISIWTFLYVLACIGVVCFVPERDDVR